jgi:hypothetical protein
MWPMAACAATSRSASPMTHALLCPPSRSIQESARIGAAELRRAPPGISSARQTIAGVEPCRGPLSCVPRLYRAAAPHVLRRPAPRKSRDPRIPSRRAASPSRGRSAADVFREIGPLEGETLDELLTFFAKARRQGGSRPIADL